MAKKIAEKMTGKDVPTGVKVLAVLAYIGAAYGVLSGILIMIGGTLLGSLIQLPGGAALGAAVGIVAGIMSIAMAVLEFFIGRGLWKAQNWARITAIVFAALGILGGLMMLMASPVIGIIYVILAGLIVWYLGFNKQVKAAFA